MALPDSDSEGSPVPVAARKGRKPGARRSRQSEPDSGDESSPRPAPKRTSNGKGKRPAKAAAAAAAAAEDDDEAEMSEEERRPAKRRSNGKGKGKGKAPAREAQRMVTLDGSDDDEEGGGGAGGDGGGSDDEATFHFTQESQEAWVATQGTSNVVNDRERNMADKVPAVTKELLIGNMMRFVLLKGSRYEPITKTQMRSEVMGEDKKHRVFNFVLNEASRRLKASMGLALYQTQPGKPYSAKDTWYLLNDTAAAANAKHNVEVADPEQTTHRGFLMIVLGFIYCQQNKKLNEDALFRHLSELDSSIPVPSGGGGKGKGRAKAGASAGIVGPVRVDGLGEITGLLATFVRQHYLRKEKSETADGEPMDCYLLGARAYLEVGRRQLITFIAETLGESADPSAVQEISDVEDTGKDDEEEGEGAAAAAAAN